MSLMRWAKLFLVGGLLLAVGAALPGLLLTVLPPAFSQGVFGLIAIMLSLSLMPFGVLVAAVGLILLAVALVRRAGAVRAPVREPSPPAPPRR